MFRNPGVYDIFNNKGLSGKLNHLITKSVTSFTPESKEEKKLNKLAVVSSKVGVELFIDPDWSVGTLENALRDNVRLIHKLAQAKKEKSKNDGRKFSDSSEYDETRELKRVNANLNLLGYYRLLECEKWSWADANTLISDRDKNRKKGEVISVRPISFEHYTDSVRNVFLNFKHSDNLQLI